MAFGFPAHHRAETTLVGPPATIFETVSRAIFSLNWKIRFQTTDAIEATTGVSFWSWGEKVTIQLFSDGRVEINSRCAWPTQCIDWGKNRRNVHRLLEAMGQRV